MSQLSGPDICPEGNQRIHRPSSERNAARVHPDQPLRWENSLLKMSKKPRPARCRSYGPCGSGLCGTYFWQSRGAHLPSDRLKLAIWVAPLPVLPSSNQQVAFWVARYPTPSSYCQNSASWVARYPRFPTLLPKFCILGRQADRARAHRRNSERSRKQGARPIGFDGPLSREFAGVHPKAVPSGPSRPPPLPPRATQNASFWRQSGRGDAGLGR